MSDQEPLRREGILAFQVKDTIESITTKTFGRLNVRRLDYARAISIREFSQTGLYDMAYFILSVVDKDGNQIFTLAKEDMEALGKLPPGVIQEAVVELLQLNTAAIEDEIKNSQAGPTEDSPTA